jgi:hypothetical protein
MNPIDIDSWLYRWWILATFHAAILCGTAPSATFRSAFMLWLYLAVLNFGRFAYSEAREALERRRRSAAPSAPWSADFTQCDPLSSGTERP